MSVDFRFQAGAVCSGCTTCAEGVTSNAIIAGDFSTICPDCYTKIFHLVAQNRPDLLAEYLEKVKEAKPDKPEIKCKKCGEVVIGHGALLNHMRLKHPRQESRKAGLKAEVLA